jgi:sporulation protein YlmC with PRC-barrel domain
MIMMTGTMVLLSDSEQMMTDPDQDIRGRKVRDRDGNELGKIDDLLIDQEHKKVRLLRVEHGGLFGIGATPLYIPVNAVERVTDDEVVISRSRVQVAEAPHYDPELIDGDKYFADLYRYYG